METPEQKRKRQFDYMTSTVLKEREERVLAAVHYSALGNLVFIISALVTLFQAILATVAQANLSWDYFQDISNVLIAVFAAFSVFWQSLVKHWDYPKQAGFHNATASALEKLYNISVLRAREEAATVYGKMEAEHQDDGNGEGDGVKVAVTPNTQGNAKNGDIYADTVTLTRQFEQAIESCESNVPVRITAAYDDLDTYIMMSRRLVVGRGGADNIIAWEKVYPVLYRQLTTEIITQPGWPYKLPNPEVVVRSAIKKFESEMDASLLKSLLKNNEVIRESYEPYQTNRQYAPPSSPPYYGAASEESKQQDETATESTPLV